MRSGSGGTGPRSEGWRGRHRQGRNRRRLWRLWSGWRPAPTTAPVPPRRELLRWAGGDLETTGTAADEAYYVVARDPNSDAFEVYFYANEDSRGQQLAGDFATMEAARTAAEVHNAGRPR